VLLAQQQGSGEVAAVWVMLCVSASGVRCVACLRRAMCYWKKYLSLAESNASTEQIRCACHLACLLLLSLDSLQHVLVSVSLCGHALLSVSGKGVNMFADWLGQMR
jgi:hypothetical protein